MMCIERRSLDIKTIDNHVEEIFYGIIDQSIDKNRMETGKKNKKRKKKKKIQDP